MKRTDIERMEWWANNKPTSGTKQGEFWVSFQKDGLLHCAFGKTLYDAIDNAISGNIKILMSID